MALRDRGFSQAAFLLQARLARRRARRLQQALRFGRRALQNAPVFFANSFPKSGTHLLTQVLAGLSEIGPAVISGLPAIVTFEGYSGRQRSQDEILHDIQRLLPGDIAYGHLHANPEITAHVGGGQAKYPFAAYFLLRDPRDVVVSHVHYVSEMEKKHILHAHYQHLDGFNERLKASIMGVRRNDLERKSYKLTGSIEARDRVVLPEQVLPDIKSRLEPYFGWLDHANLLTLRFEDFISEREKILGKVFDHAVRLGFKCELRRSQAIKTLEKSIDPGRSPTFRSGKTGGWRSAFTVAHKDLFKEVSGDLLQRLGYEESNDW